MTSPILWSGREVTAYFDAVVSSVATTTSFLDQQTGATGYQAWLKDVTIGGAEGDVEVVNCLGETTTNFQNQYLEKKPFGHVEITGTAVFAAVGTDKGLSAEMTGAGTAITSGYIRYQFGGDGAAATLRSARSVSLVFGGAYTRLNGALSGGETTITVLSTEGFATAGNLGIETDVDITYTGKTSTTFTGCANAGAHSNSKPVTQIRGTSDHQCIVGMNNLLWTKFGDIKVTADGHAELSFTAKCLSKDYYEEYDAA